MASGKPIARMLRWRDECRDAFNGLYSHSAAFGATREAMETRKREILARHPLTRWASGYLEGYWAHIIDQAYRHDLVYGGWVEGRFLSTHSNRNDYYGKCGISARDWHDLSIGRGHYWANTLKPFYTSQD